MIDQLTYTLTQMIAHQRQAESCQGEAQEDHLSPAELSSLLDIVQAQIEYHQAEIARLRPILHRLQARIPNDSFSELLNNLQEV